MVLGWLRTFTIYKEIGLVNLPAQIYKDMFLGWVSTFNLSSEIDLADLVNHDLYENTSRSPKSLNFSTIHIDIVLGYLDLLSSPLRGFSWYKVPRI